MGCCSVNACDGHMHRSAWDAFAKTSVCWEGFSLPVVLRRKSEDSHNSQLLGESFLTEVSWMFSLRHVCLSAAMNSCKSNFIRVGIFIHHHWLASTNWIPYIQKWNKSDWTILKLWMIMAARRFVPHTVTCHTPLFLSHKKRLPCRESVHL